MRLRRFLALAVVLLLGTVAYGWRFHDFRASLRSYEAAHHPDFAGRDFPCLSREQAVNLGTAHSEVRRPQSSYTVFTKKKPAGTVRIGVFGCSFVEGSEAAFGFDYPSRLQRLLAAGGAKHVQVLNFGVGGYGVQQSYLLWQYLADDFDLDYTVFNLYGFHARRDTTFVMLDDIYAPIHARYVMRNGELELIPVGGDSRLCASEVYFGLLPRWRYLRYDSKAPPQLRALLPQDRRLGNPFYYRADTGSEVQELYSSIFEDMARGSPQLLVLRNDSRHYPFLEELSTAGPSIYDSSTASFAWRRRGFYLAPRNHLSALGYEILAREVLALLGNDHDASFPALELESIDEPSFAGGADQLNRYEDVFLSVAGSPFARIVVENGDRPTRPMSFADAGITALIDVSGRAEMGFLAVTEGVTDGMVLRLKFTVDGVAQMARIGTVRPLAGAVWRIEQRWKKQEGEHWQLRRRPGASPLALEIAAQGEVGDLSVSVAERTIFTGTLGAAKKSGWAGIELQGHPTPVLRVRGHEEQRPDLVLDSAPATIDLTLVAEDGSLVYRPTCEYRVVMQPFPQRRALAHPLRARGSP